MPEEKKKKKGFLSAIRDSMNKTGGCCGPGETCGCSATATGLEMSKGKEKKKIPLNSEPFNAILWFYLSGTTRS